METDLAPPIKIGSTTSLGIPTIEVRLQCIFRRLVCLKPLRELLQTRGVPEREIAELESTLAEPPRVGRE
jgi:hypothetical protein